LLANVAYIKILRLHYNALSITVTDDIFTM